MSLAMLAALMVAGIAISNERALFNAGADFDEAEAAATIKALAAVIHPQPWDVGIPAHVLPLRHASRVPEGQAPQPAYAFAARAPTPADQVAPVPTPDALPSDMVTTPDAAPAPLIFNPPTSGPPPILGVPSGPGPVDPGNPGNPGNPDPPTSPVPEPSVWALLVLGFGAVGSMMRLAAKRRHASRIRTA